MREITLLAFGAVAIVGGTFFWMSGRTGQRTPDVIGVDNPEEQKLRGATGANPASKTKRKNPGSAAKAGPAVSSIDTGGTPILAALAGMTSAPPQIQVSFEIVDLPEFPEPHDFSKGMLRSEIERRYGKPTLSTVQTRSGRLLQHYVYVNLERTAVTVAIFEDERVVSALHMPQ